MVALSARKQFSPISGVKPRTDLIKAINYIVSNDVFIEYDWGLFDTRVS
jgi:hypothetical protein